MEPSTVRISYLVEGRDVLANRHWQQRRPAGRAVIRREYRSGLVAGLLSASICLGLVRLFDPRFPILWAALVAYSGVALIWHVIYRVALKRADRKYVTALSKAATGAHTLTLTPEGITEERPQGSVSHRWSAIDEIAATPDHVFVSVGTDGTYIVPRRCFETREAADAFVAALSGYRNRAA